MAPPPAPYASLRLTRPLSENMVLTVEPGLYFIPMLLNEQRAAKAPINWALVDLLTPFGGIRIEDNIRLLPEAAGVENLTRDAFQKPKSQLPILDRIKQQEHSEQPFIYARH